MPRRPEWLKHHGRKLTETIVNDMVQACDLPPHLDDEDLHRLRRTAQDLADAAKRECETR